MYEAANYFVTGVITLIIGTVCTALCLKAFKTKGYNFKNESTVYKLSKLCSRLPFYVNIAAIISYSFIAIMRDSYIALIPLIPAIFLSSISATVLIFAEIIGIAVNIQLLKRGEKIIAVNNLTFGIIALVISAVFLCMYVHMLFPYFASYYNLR